MLTSSGPQRHSLQVSGPRRMVTSSRPLEGRGIAGVQRAGVLWGPFRWPDSAPPHRPVRSHGTVLRGGRRRSPLCGLLGSAEARCTTAIRLRSDRTAAVRTRVYWRGVASCLVRPLSCLLRTLRCKDFQNPTSSTPCEQPCHRNRSIPVIPEPVGHERFRGEREQQKLAEEDPSTSSEGVKSEW
jgi:hypothetical protein